MYQKIAFVECVHHLIGYIVTTTGKSKLSVSM